MAIVAILLLVVVGTFFGWKNYQGNTIHEIFITEQSGLSDTTWSSIQVLQKTLLEKPEELRIIFALAQQYLQGVRENADSTLYDRVDVLLDKAENLEPDNTDIDFLRVQILLSKHEFAEALPLAKKIVALRPDADIYYGSLVDAQIELGMYEEAEESLQTMVDIKPSPAAFTRISYLRELNGLLEGEDGAIKMMEDTILSGSNIPENLAWNLSELGRLWLNLDLQKADISYQKAQQAYPDFPYGLEGLGKVEVIRGNLEKALEHFQKAFDILPLPQFAIKISEVYAKQGNTDKAQLYQKLAEVGYESIKTKGSNVNLELAEFLTFQGLKLDQALTLAKTAYEERPSIFSADVLAWAHYQNKQVAEAAVYSSKALRTNSKNALILYHACEISKANGKSRSTCQQPLLNSY
jgi:tetratricopeptide (TPR) repeat protein